MSGPDILRRYQLDAIEQLREHWREGARRLLLVSPTGSGKTVIAAYLLASALQHGSRSLFCAHRQELIYQSYRKLIEAGVSQSQLGVVMGRNPRMPLTRENLHRPEAPIQVGSVDTLRNRELPPADIVVIDEAHRSLAETYVRIIDEYVERGAVVLGMTATPFRGNGGGLGDVYEKLYVVARPSELIAQGYIVAPRVFSGTDVSRFRALLSKVRVTGGDYMEGDLAALMSEPALVGNIVAHWLKLASGIRTVVFGVNVAHSRAICDRFVAAGIPAEHIDADTPDEVRAAILKRLEDGVTLVVCNCGILCEGWDQPSVKCAVLARPTKSPVLFLQQAGRLLRPWNDVVPIVLDHACNTLEHGLPQTDRDYSLTPKHRGEGTFGAPVKVCPECHAMVLLALRSCPECGCKFVDQREPPEEDDQELTEIKPLDAKALTEAWNKLVEEWQATNEFRVATGMRPMKPGFIWHRFKEMFHAAPPQGCQLPPDLHATDEERAAELERLIGICAERGYKSRWVDHRYREKFGRDP